MEPFFIAASPDSPEISFDFARHHLSLRGPCSPPDAAAFYAPVLERLRAWLALCDGRSIDAHVALASIDAPSAAMLAALLETLNDAAIFGNEVRLHWYRDEEDDWAHAFGEEVREDFSGFEFVDCVVPARAA
ncbi:DUF1987 domain-containing protein [Pseudoduganella lutea]|uniref:DUF1987 domain-containing protein n=1 Tax=Pseudoduganella lutea TaxID=321985 RepID=A0A4P6L5J6_9BURK|nr:DUF1987 domain-containing protein [Pseudoduganella lutea]QBE66734.1 DUF1987 domain-containing protein [Pseudoduganella lutea]